MAKNENPNRRLKGYYKFSKKYPSRRGIGYAIGESRKMRKKERTKRILLAVLVCFVFAFVYVAAMFFHNLITRPIPQQPVDETPIITSDNIGTIRAIYLNNESLADISELSQTLDEASENGFNAVMLDFKTRDGYLTYKSKFSNDYSNSEKITLITDDVIDRIKSENLMIIARIFCFEDGLAPQKLNAFVYEDPELTKIWFDGPAVYNGKPWLNPAVSASSEYLCGIIREVSALGTDGIYLESVQFPQLKGERPSNYTEYEDTQFYTADDSTLNRNLILLDFIERAVNSADNKPVILGSVLEAAEGGNIKKWGGTIFDTAAPVFSPLILPAGDDYIYNINTKTNELTERAKNNFSTLKIIPTVKNRADDDKFFEKIAESDLDSYIIIP